MKINYDIDGEISLLGTCLYLDNCLFETCQSLTPENFYDPVNQLIFQSILQLYRENSNVNLETLAARLNINNHFERTRDTLPKLTAYASNGNYKTHLKNILINFKKTRIAELIRNISHDFEEKNIHQISEICGQYFNNTSQVKTYTLEDISEGEFYGYKNFEEFITIRHQEYHQGKKISGYSTGFFDLDNAINGLNPSHYTIIAGQPGSGKTTFAIQIMKNLIESGVKCGFLSLEMTKEQAYVKLISHETGIPFNQVQKGQFNDNQKYQIFAAQKKLRLNKLLYLQDAQVDNLMSLRTRIKNLVEVIGIKVLFVDYITLIRNAINNSSPVEQIQGVSHEIRALLNQLKIPGIIISQLNRASTENTNPPDKHHLYGSGQLEKDAHEILMLHPDQFTRERTLFIRKNRFGIENMAIKYEFNNGVFKEKNVPEQHY